MSGSCSCWKKWWPFSHSLDTKSSQTPQGRIPSRGSRGGSFPPPPTSVAPGALSPQPLPTTSLYCLHSVCVPRPVRTPATGSATHPPVQDALILT